MKDRCICSGGRSRDKWFKRENGKLNDIRTDIIPNEECTTTWPCEKTKVDYDHELRVNSYRGGCRVSSLFNTNQTSHHSRTRSHPHNPQIPNSKEYLDSAKTQLGCTGGITVVACVQSVNIEKNLI